MLSILREQCPPEAKVRGSNPLGRAITFNIINDLKILAKQVLGKIVGKNNSKKIPKNQWLFSQPKSRVPETGLAAMAKRCGRILGRFLVRSHWQFSSKRSGYNLDGSEHNREGDLKNINYLSILLRNCLVRGFSGLSKNPSGSRSSTKTPSSMKMIR